MAKEPNYIILSKEKYEASVEKWERIVSALEEEPVDWSPDGELNRAATLTCGYCQAHIEQKGHLRSDCDGCPLWHYRICGYLEDVPVSHYAKWGDGVANENREKALYHAKIILAFIKEDGERNFKKGELKMIRVFSNSKGNQVGFKGLVKSLYKVMPTSLKATERVVEQIILNTILCHYNEGQRDGLRPDVYKGAVSYPIIEAWCRQYCLKWSIADVANLRREGLDIVRSTIMKP